MDQSKEFTPQKSVRDRRPDKSFLGVLLEKEAAFRRIGEETGKNVNPAINDVQRQEKQVSLQAGGNPITGEGVTKSGPED